MKCSLRISKGQPPGGVGGVTELMDSIEVIAGQAQSSYELQSRSLISPSIDWKVHLAHRRLEKIR